jgi:hypothetical protein
MHFVAGECREKGADYSHPSSRPNAMAVVIVHGVKSARPYLVDLTFVQFLDRALALQTITGLEVVLLPENHTESGLKDSVG